MTAGPDFDSPEAREARFRTLYDLPAAGELTVAVLEASLSAWRRCDMSETWLEGLLARLEEVRCAAALAAAVGAIDAARAFRETMEAELAEPDTDAPMPGEAGYPEAAGGKS